MKETFIIRSEWYKAISRLTPKDQAIVFRNLFEYHAGEQVDLSSKNVQLVWELIEPNLKRNITEYDRRRETSALNGKLGGRPRKDEKPNNLITKPNKPTEPNETLSVLVLDTVTDINTDKKIAFRKNVKLTQSEYDRLVSEKGKDFIEGLLDYFGDYKTEKKYKTQSDNLTIRRWVIEAFEKTKVKPRETQVLTAPPLRRLTPGA